MQTAKKSFIQRLNPFSKSENTATNAQELRSTLNHWSEQLASTLGITFSQGGAISSNPKTASTLTAIARAQSIIADGIATMPLKDYRKVSGGKEEVTDSNITMLLREPIAGMTNYTFRRLLTLWAVRYGNGVAFIEKDKSGKAIGLIPILPENVTEPQFIDGKYLYTVRVGGDVYYPTVYDVVHIKYNSNNGIWGISPLVQHAQSLGISLNAEKYGLDYFQNGGKPAFYASTPSALGEVSRKALQESLRESFAASNNGFALMDNGLMLHTISANPSETQFSEVRAYGISEASRIYGVPKYMLSDASDSSYTNSETEYISFYNGTLMAHAICQEQEYTIKLYTEVEKRSGRYLKHNFNALMRADSTTRAAFYGALYRMGVFNADDIREKEDMNSLPDGVGKTYFTDANLIPLSKFDDFYDAKISVLIGQDMANQTKIQA